MADNRNTFKRSILLAAFVTGFAVLVPATASADSVRITSETDSVRITASCDETDREHILCQ